MPDVLGVEKVRWKGDGDPKSEKVDSSVLNAPSADIFTLLSIDC